MCGIFGVVCSSSEPGDRQLVRDLAISLLHNSETRGKEACGVAIHDGEQIHVLKQGGSALRITGSVAPRWPRMHAVAAKIWRWHAASPMPQSSRSLGQPCCSSSSAQLMSSASVNTTAQRATH